MFAVQGKVDDISRVQEEQRNKRHQGQAWHKVQAKK
jgi:hypothetical protein